MSQDLPVKQTDEFIADLEVMDLTELKEKTFLVGVSSGDRSKHKFLCTTIRGPFTFTEMCDEVGNMWYNYQHHAKVLVCEKDRKKPIKVLDENTIDYIEANFTDIITESMLEGIFDNQAKLYTCRAGLVEDDMKEHPKAEEKKAEEQEEEDL